MSKQLIDLATEVADSREAEVPIKLLKIRELALYNDDPKKMKYDIYKFELLEALSVAFTYEYGIIREGWQLALDLVKTFVICTTDFEMSDKNYQSNFLPNAAENALILAKKIQDKHVKSKSYSEEFLRIFRELMDEYVKIIRNNQFIAGYCLKSQRLFQLLLNDEQYTSAIMLNTYNNIFKIKNTLLRQMDETSLFILLDEIVYKMATSELAECGIAILRLLNTMCQLDPYLMKSIVRRYKGIKMIINQWGGRISSNELKKFFEQWEDADRTKFTDQEIHNKAVSIQRHWRGYTVRRRLQDQKQTQASEEQDRLERQAAEEEKSLRLQAENELNFQLMLIHRRRQRQYKCQLLQLLEILPPDQLPLFEERQREYSATVIQAWIRGNLARKKIGNVKELAKRKNAAITIQKAMRRYVKTVKERREQPAFYSRPRGLDGPRREFLFDKIRQHLDSLPPHPRTLKSAEELHDRSQRAFQNYVLGQRSLRQQQHNIQLLMTLNNNDADLLTNCPKLSQVNPEDVDTFYSHKSKEIATEARRAHKKMLKKQKSPWYRVLNGDSDSDDDLVGLDEDGEDDLSSEIRNLNFEIETDHYFRELRLTNKPAYRKQPNELGITKQERNQLKTTYLRKVMTQMMKTAPSEARFFKDELFDDKNVQHTLSLLQSRASDLPK